MITNQQVKNFMKYNNVHNQEVAASKSGMDVKTARKYKKLKKLPSEAKKPHNWRTRKNPFQQDWDLIESFLRNSDALQAKTMLEHLIEKYPGRYQMSHLRTLQRYFRIWRAEFGKERAVIFPQIHYPGAQSQSDFTSMNNLQITICGQPYPHTLFHFTLVYSRWEDAMICHSESFDNLLAGFEQAVWRLGGVVREHRTDNLSAVMNNQVKPKQFTEKWKQVTDHYKIKPTTNNPGISHENGSVEKSHDLFKNDVAQQLILRGSRNFASIDEYQAFIDHTLKKRNLGRIDKLREEQSKLLPLPNDKLLSPKLFDVRVCSGCYVKIERIPYSVPSRLIGYMLRAKVYLEKIELYLSQRLIQTMPRLKKGCGIQYIHIIDSLVRKPGAFAHYRYQAVLFPHVVFRRAYDRLCQYSPQSGYKIYLQLLRLAKWHGEEQVRCAIELLLAENILPLVDEVSALLLTTLEIPKVTIKAVNLCSYDDLRTGTGEVTA